MRSKASAADGRRRHRGKPTLHSMAKLDFKPWTRTADMKPDELIPRFDVWTHYGVIARLAYAIMLRSREELIGAYRNLEQEAINETMENLDSTIGDLSATIGMLKGAQGRMLAAASAYIVRERAA